MIQTKLCVLLVVAVLATSSYAGAAASPASNAFLERMQNYFRTNGEAGRAQPDLRVLELGPDSDLDSRLSAYGEVASLPGLDADEQFRGILRDEIEAARSLSNEGVAPALPELEAFKNLPSVAGEISELESAQRRLALDRAQVSAEALTESASAAPLYPPTRSTVYSSEGMVAGPHPMAAQAGLWALQKGGNAVDAAIATWFLQASVGDRAMSSYGGDMMVLYYDAKTKQYYALNASGRSPKSLDIQTVLKKYPGAKLIPLNKPESWTVPGVVDGIFKLHERFGKLPMKTLLQPAIQAAEEGTQITRVVDSDIHWPGWDPTGQPGFKETYMIDGKLPKEGQRLKNPALARTLRVLAKGGRDAFYVGAIAKALLEFSAKNGGYFTKEDLAQDHADWVEPYATEYRGATVRELPPNGQGFAVLQILNIMRLYDFKALGWNPGHVDFWHTFIEAKKLVYEIMAKIYGDLDYMKPQTLQWLLSEDLARQLKAMIDPKKAAVISEMHLPTPPGARAEGKTDRTSLDLPEAERIRAGDTTNLVTADAEGNMVSLIQSPYFPFGSGYVVRNPEDDYDLGGFALQNRGALFSLDPNSPNALSGGKRPFHTIIPSIVEYFRNGEKRRLAFSIMGADLQAYGQALLLMNILDFGMDVQQAIDAPRMVLSGSTSPKGAPAVGTGIFYPEPGIPEAVVAELQRRGHKITTTSDPNRLNYYTGGAHMIEHRQSASGDRYFAGGSDPRKDGGAVPLLSRAQSRANSWWRRFLGWFR